MDFRSYKFIDLFSEEAIKLCRRIVSDQSACLATIVHEVAHRKGLDGEKAHIAEIERIWSVIVEHLHKF